MTFYTYNYLTNRNETWQYARLIIILILLAIFAGLFVHYLRHRWNVKYKDLSVITGVVILLFLGFQINGIMSLKASNVQANAITTTIKEVGKRLDVKPTTISVNGTTTSNNLLFKTSKGYYRTTYNSDGSAFVLEKVTLTNPKIKIVKGQ